MHQREERWEERKQFYESELARMQKELEYIKKNTAGQRVQMAKGKLSRLSREIEAVEKLGFDGIRGKKWAQVAAEAGNIDKKPMRVHEAESRLGALHVPDNRLQQLNLKIRAKQRSGNIVLRGENLAVQNVLIWSPFFYIDPMWQFLMAMQLGGTAFIATRMSLSKFMDWLVDYEIHYCAFPEPALKVHPPSERDRDVKLKFISAFGWRGEANREVEARFGLVARNSYGMTEIGGGISLPAGATHMVDKETCGLPAIRREVRIVDEQGRDVPQGEIGELWVAGRGIFWGYYNRPRPTPSPLPANGFTPATSFAATKTAITISSDASRK